jgi:uncharacterized Zn-finger protein
MMNRTTPSLPDAPETIIVDTTRISCDGGGGALGHPKVWYSLRDGLAECGYCDRRFVLRAVHPLGSDPDHGQP